MNNKRRGNIRNAINRIDRFIALYNEQVKAETAKGYLNSVSQQIEDILYEESEAFENMPENLQCSFRGETAQECIDLLEDAASRMDDIKDDLDSSSFSCEDVKDKLSDLIDVLEDVIYA